MNRIVLTGRLTKDPDMQYPPNMDKAVCKFTLAVDRQFKNKNGEKETDFVPIVVWGKSAENTANYCSKGKMVGVSGRLQIRRYETKDGAKRTIAEVVADEVQFLDKMNQGQAPAAEEFEGMTEAPGEDIPF